MKLREDCTIVRSGHTAGVHDKDGKTVFLCPKDWTDDVIWKALAIWNRGHDQGQLAGKAAKAAEIKVALGLPAY